ncbi:MAG: primosomal protein [Verrucomicrobiaceae bacterium]|nr:primosomal protein [Verrucomicrobiaceae bacterium]
MPVVTVILRVAVPSPLRRLFDYLPPAACATEDLVPGLRVRVPFGQRELIGILIEVADATDIGAGQLKSATEVLDRQPIFSLGLLSLLRWAADYYHTPLGECVAQALPTLLRQGESASSRETHWRLTIAGMALPEGALKRAKQQAHALALLQKQASISTDELKAAGVEAPHLRALAVKGLAERFEIDVEMAAPLKSAHHESPLQLSPEQGAAVAAVTADFDTFRCHLLEGVTGSGKTEVYLHLLAQVIARGEQALVLIPEIGLTPQTLARFQQRLQTPIAVLHSGLSDNERLKAWRLARSGRAGVVLGTRSAVFTAFARLRLIIVDEEHDASYKQQDGFRYSARDIAIKRAADENIPILLGSATPSLETLHNALSGRYRHSPLRERAAGAAQPTLDVIDIRHAPMREGLAPAVVDALASTSQRGDQALVFLNRRGFAPTLICHDCGWIAQCPHCDTRLTVHVGEQRLRCHHCGHVKPLVKTCPDCRSTQLQFRGPGTERLEMVLTALFPQVPVVRIDRDTTQRKHALRDKVATVSAGQPCILVGTQMLAKGHHFPDVTLVVMVDIDGGLFSADLRAPERMGQLLTQVAGRAGRAEKSGRVLIQTHYPDHPLITGLVRDGYHAFACRLLDERRISGAPPFGFFALVRADARSLTEAEQLLAEFRQAVTTQAGVQALGPLPAPLSRRAGMYRAQLLLTAMQRAALHRALHKIVEHAEREPLARRVKWSIDVDPVDFS